MLGRRDRFAKHADLPFERYAHRRRCFNWEKLFARSSAHFFLFFFFLIVSRLELKIKRKRWSYILREYVASSETLETTARVEQNKKPKKAHKKQKEGARGRIGKEEKYPS